MLDDELESPVGLLNGLFVELFMPLRLALFDDGVCLKLKSSDELDICIICGWFGYYRLFFAPLPVGVVCCRKLADKFLRLLLDSFDADKFSWPSTL